MLLKISYCVHVFAQSSTVMVRLSSTCCVIWLLEAVLDIGTIYTSSQFVLRNYSYYSQVYKLQRDTTTTSKTSSMAVTG